LLNLNYKFRLKNKNKIPFSIKHKIYNYSNYYSGVKEYVAQYGAFSGVGVILFNFLVYLKANYRRIIPFKIQIPLKSKFKI
jgi:hypothetical protein